MRIAIVDDIASECENLKARVTAQLTRLSLDAVVSCYASGTDFLTDAGKEHFNLVFLDIYMGNENGVDTAKELRRFDPDCLLVFTNTSTDHALDGFRVRALHYLVKPYEDTALAALFDEIVKRFPKTDRYIEINTTGGIIRLRFQNILYAEHYQHQIYIYCTDGEKYVTRQTFREFTAALTGGAVSCFFHINALWLFFPIAIIMGSFYIRTLRITRWKSVSVFLAVCGAFSCMGSAAIGMSSILSPGVSAPPLPFRAVLFWFVMCCVVTALSWYPATHAARNLLEDDAFAQTWYVFWFLPLLFIGLNLTMVPKNPDMLQLGRLRQLYILFSFVFLFLLLLSYVLFYLMATSLNRNDRLRWENQFLSMQQARYDNLRSTIGQIRQARHDMRHHFHVLQSLAAQGNLESITKYLDEAQGNIPAEDLGLCKNSAVDSVASYFMPLCRKEGIPLAFELDLPRELPVSEPDLCSVMSNLLENAMEASIKTAPERRQVKMSARLHSGHMVLLSVENTYDGKVKEKDGVFISSKRSGEGIGLQAVRHIAEKNGGYCRFLYGDGVFCVNVILRGGK